MFFGFGHKCSICHEYVEFEGGFSFCDFEKGIFKNWLCFECIDWLNELQSQDELKVKSR